MSFDIICVVGLGYIGLPTAAMLASQQKTVIGVDINQYAVDTINAGNVHIVEPGLDVIVRSAVAEGYLKAVISPVPADAFFIAVPTPFLREVGADESYQPDLSFIEAASRAIAKVLKKGNLVILESTCPVGATERMAEWLAEERTDLSFPQTHGEDSDIRIAHCPERVLPGHVVKELVENDRIIGGMTDRCASDAVNIYKCFVEGECLKTNVRTAEMAKLTENASRDVGIAFANELSIICDKLDINVWELIAVANRHPRVNILKPGPGVGGHCIAVDPWFIVSSTPKEARLIRAAREINDDKPSWVLEKVKLALADFLQVNPDRSAREVTIVCYGLAFKPDIDDLRESPSVMIVSNIVSSHPGRVVVVEPYIDHLPDSIEKAELMDFQDARHLSAIHLMLVDHSIFKENRPSSDLIIDTRGIWL